MIKVRYPSFKMDATHNEYTFENLLDKYKIGGKVEDIITIEELDDEHIGR